MNTKKLSGKYEEIYAKNTKKLFATFAALQVIGVIVIADFLILSFYGWSAPAAIIFSLIMGTITGFPLYLLFMAIFKAPAIALKDIGN